MFLRLVTADFAFWRRNICCKNLYDAYYSRGAFNYHGKFSAKIKIEVKIPFTSSIQLGSISSFANACHSRACPIMTGFVPKTRLSTNYFINLICLEMRSRIRFLKLSGSRTFTMGPKLSTRITSSVSSKLS